MSKLEYPHTELIPKLIPRTMWGKNVRAVISHQNWEAFRWAFKATTRPASFAVTTARNLGLPEPGRESARQCHYCDERQESLHLHELWDYDDVNRIQKLIDLVPVCEDCHLSLHIGYANTINYGNKAKEHLAYLNQWSKSKADRKIEEIYVEWIKRSKHEYSLDLSYLTNWLPVSQIHYDWLLRTDRWVGNKIDAIAWAQELLNSNALIVDTETTGLRDKQNAEVIELAIINMHGGFTPFPRTVELSVNPAC